MDSERSNEGDGLGGDAEVEDEFTCSGMLRGSLNSLHGTVERIFRVKFGIGSDDLLYGNNGQIWLKLRGSNTNVKAAKLFVKGVVNQEEQQEVQYPPALHCIFCGARGLFTDSLVKSTSAHIVVGSPGFLLISGLAEPVVRAYSLIADLVARYEGMQSRRTDMGDRGSSESLESRRAFKVLVEKWDDRHSLDLLVLPWAVKEILLDLVKDSVLGQSPISKLPEGNAGTTSNRQTKYNWDKLAADNQNVFDLTGTTDQSAGGMAAGKDSSVKDSTFQAFLSPVGTRGRAEGAEERLPHLPKEMGEEEQLEQLRTLDIKGTKRQQSKEQDQTSMGNKEFLLLLKFFTAMGYTEDVVKRVLAITGPKEASQILDLVQQEQDRSDREQKTSCVSKTNDQDNDALNQREDQPCETEHDEDEGAATGGAKVAHGNGETGTDQELEEEGAVGDRAEVEMTLQEDDFVLGVLKKAALSCGYTEQNVTKIYNRMPEGSTHQLLLELQKEGSRESDNLKEEAYDIQDVVLEKGGHDNKPAEIHSRGEVELFLQKETKESNEKKPDLSTWIDKTLEFSKSKYTSQPTQHSTQHSTQHQDILPEVKGPPLPTYSSSLDPQTFLSNKQQNIRWSDPFTSKHNPQTHVHQSNSKKHPSDSSKPHQAHYQIPAINNSSSTKTREKQNFISPSSLVVTGQQRFLEGLQTPFDLKLTDQPGDQKLRTIIIDGSNVAMSHGLGHFFSCRGIALAVQHFWDRGHRHISALVPQWRQKMDPRIKEQHYLTDLQNLGLLSFTPSREFQHKRICSYDDRLILQLAQKTDGVIVTNDNLRDLSDESPVWRDIIKKRLLQYTFVGDLFMVPDDPLGRGGPHLDDFLRSEHRTPDPGNHSFAGLATPCFSSKPPRSQTEVLNFRDRTPGSGLDASGGGGLGRGKAHGKGWDREVQLRQHEPGGGDKMVSLDRTTEETVRLREQLLSVFLGQENMVTLVMQCHPAERDINVLSDLILEQQRN